jgi:hypothetical protein
MWIECAAGGFVLGVCVCVCVRVCMRACVCNFSKREKMTGLSVA